MYVIFNVWNDINHYFMEVEAETVISKPGKYKTKTISITGYLQRKVTKVRKLAFFLILAEVPFLRFIDC